jgi:hypothetical protein
MRCCLTTAHKVKHAPYRHFHGGGGDCDGVVLHTGLSCIQIDTVLQHLLVEIEENHRNLCQDG